MAQRIQLSHVYDRPEQFHDNLAMPQDHDVFAGHNYYIDRPHPRDDAPPPYEPISYPFDSPVTSPLPSPAFFLVPPVLPVQPTIPLHARPLPQAFLDDPAFSSDPRTNPHFIMTTAEHIRAAPPPPPRDPPAMRPIPPSLQSGFGIATAPPTQHVWPQSMPYAPPIAGASLQDVVSPPPSQARPTPPPKPHSRTISASSLFPINPMWHPPVPSSPSSGSGSSVSSHSSFVYTPSASSPSSAVSSPRHSSASGSSAASAYSGRDKPTPPLPVAPAIGQEPVVPARIQGPPRSSSLARPSRTPIQPSASLPSPATITASATARPIPPLHSESAPELHNKPPPPPQVLTRSATAPARPEPSTQTQNQAPTRSQSQSHHDEQTRGRSREQQPQPPQGVQRNRSRRPSVSAPRDLDRIDELDETDPRGLAWHHGGPYEITRSISERRKEGRPQPSDVSASIAAGATAQMQRSRSKERAGERQAERPAPRRKPSSSSFSIEPGQIFPAAALYQATQAPYIPPQAQVQAHGPPFNPFATVSADDSGPRLSPHTQVVYTPGAPPLPPQASSQQAEEPRRRRASSHSRSHPRSSPPAQQPTIQTQRQPTVEQPALQPFPTYAPQDPYPSPVEMPSPADRVDPSRQRPSLLRQRSQVRFESPSRPDVRPPAGQGSVDGEAHDGRELNEPSALSPVPPLTPAQRTPSTTRRAEAPLSSARPAQKVPERRTSFYAADTSSTGNAPNENMPRPDITLPPRRPAPSVQTQGSLPPRHIPKHLVMPTPLQPLEDQKRAEAARQLREQAVPGTRSDDGHGVRQDARTHGGRHLQHHHSVSYSHQPNAGPPLAPQMSSRQSSQGRAQAIPISAGPNVLRKRASNTVSAPIAAPELTSSASAAVFSARVVEPTNGVNSGGKTKVIGQVATAVWTRDRVKEEEIRRQAEREAGEKKLSRKLSKLTRKATK